VYGPPESGGEFLLICLCFIGLIANRYPVVKPDTFGYIGEAIEAARLAPAFLCRQCPLDQAQQWYSATRRSWSDSCDAEWWQSSIRSGGWSEYSFPF